MKNEEKINTKKEKGTDANRDPITKAPGAHPVGTGIGAAAGGVAGGIAAGAATGAAIGTGAAGPVGTAVGIVAGAVAGGLAGKAVAEKIDPTVEEAYWKENYRSREYVDEDDDWEVYAPAYRTGYEGASRYRGEEFDDIEVELRRDYEANETSGLEWEKARYATRDAWERARRPRAESREGCCD